VAATPTASRCVDGDPTLLAGSLGASRDRVADDLLVDSPSDQVESGTEGRQVLDESGRRDDQAGNTMPRAISRTLPVVPTSTAGSRRVRSSQVFFARSLETRSK
jgi:hypothetical protein